MLVLTRKLDESIVIDGSIVIRVIAAGRNRVKLAIEAPAHIRVQRSELIAAIHKATVAEPVVLPTVTPPPSITQC